MIWPPCLQPSARSGQWSAAIFVWPTLLIALGVLLKLYPAFLLPVVAIEHLCALSALPAEPATGRATLALQRRLSALFSPQSLMTMLRGVLLCLAVVALVFAGSFLVNASGTLSEFRYATNRPLQFESVPATLLWLTHFFGVPVQLEYGFGAFNWVSPDAGPFQLLSTVLLIAGCLLVYWRQLSGAFGFKQAFLACLCVVVATNKVLSPQYFIWLLPVVVAVDCFDGIWLLICALTVVEYPLILPLRHHLSLNSYYTVVDGILILRNGLFWHPSSLAALRAALGSRGSMCHPQWSRSRGRGRRPAVPVAT